MRSYYGAHADIAHCKVALICNAFEWQPMPTNPEAIGNGL